MTFARKIEKCIKDLETQKQRLKNGLGISNKNIYLKILHEYLEYLGKLMAEEIEEISISQLANDINQEVIKDITVSGEKIEIIYQDDTKAVTRKETESSLSESLINYGVTQEFLGKTEIHIKEVGGVWIWLNPYRFQNLMLPVFQIQILMLFFKKQVILNGV